jgi:hypothetical protein
MISVDSLLRKFVMAAPFGYCEKRTSATEYPAMGDQFPVKPSSLVQGKFNRDH